MSRSHQPCRRAKGNSIPCKLRTEHNPCRTFVPQGAGQSASHRYAPGPKTKNPPRGGFGCFKYSHRAYAAGVISLYGISGGLHPRVYLFKLFNRETPGLQASIPGVQRPCKGSGVAGTSRPLAGTTHHARPTASNADGNAPPQPLLAGFAMFQFSRAPAPDRRRSIRARQPGPREFTVGPRPGSRTSEGGVPVYNARVVSR
jgi:hypothetical protein